MTRACAVCVGALLVCMPARAHAFSDPVAFADEVDLGGGGGRFFTGSPADGYTCSVCHAGGDAVPLHVSGLPLAGYRAGTAYEVSIDWYQAVHVGLALEIADRSGAAAGTLRMPPIDELPDSERCEPYEDAIAGGTLAELPNRNVLSVPDCGARRVRFLWTAPPEQQGTVWFTGGFVHSNDMADDRGDGVTVFTRVIEPWSARPAPASSVQIGCSASARARGGAGTGGGFGAYGVALAWIAARSRSSPRPRRTPRRSGVA